MFKLFDILLFCCIPFVAFQYHDAELPDIVGDDVSVVHDWGGCGGVLHQATM